LAVETTIHDAMQAVCPVDIAVNRIGNLLWHINAEVTVLATRGDLGDPFPGLAQFLHGGGDSGRAAARDHYPRALGQKGLGNREAYAAGTAGDEVAFSVKLYGCCPYAAGG
jgi:hypothetical protein